MAIDEGFSEISMNPKFTAMKILRQLFLILPLLFLSCSDDDNAADSDDGNGNGNGNGNQETVVRYVVTAPTDIVSNVQYRVASGTYSTDSNPGANWSQEVIVPRPFNASLFVQFANSTASAKQYTLEIFVNDELEYSKSGSVAGTMTSTDSATHTIMTD